MKYYTILYMKNDLYAIKMFTLDLINFFLNTIKNSQLINLIVGTILYICVFIIILLGFLFNFYEGQTSIFITNLAKYFTYSNYNINISTYISYYLLVLFIISIIQEFILSVIYKTFIKDFHSILNKSKKIIFLVLLS